MTAELRLRFRRNEREFEVRQGRDVVAGLSASCDLCLSDYLTGARVRTISRRHFRIWYNKPDGFAIEDLDSLNGTLVNGQPLRPGEWRFLRNGDVITPAGCAEFDIEVSLDEDDVTEVVAKSLQQRERPATSGLRYLSGTDQFVVDGRAIPHGYLTPLEHTLLRYLVKNAGRVCTYDDLIEHVWGYKHYDDTQNNTVAKTVSNLRKKLNDLSPGAGTRHIHTVHGRGVEYVAEV